MPSARHGAGCRYADDDRPPTRRRVPPATDVVSSDHRLVGQLVETFTGGDDIPRFVLDRGPTWGRRWLAVPVGVIADVDDDAIELGIAAHCVGVYPVCRPSPSAVEPRHA